MAVLFITSCGNSNQNDSSRAETEESQTGSGTETEESQTGSGTDEVLAEDEDSDDEETQTDEERDGHKSKIRNMNCQEFDELLSTLPVSVVRTQYIVQDEEYKILYPDMLQAVIENNSDNDIKNVTIAFAAWDEHNLPVKIMQKNGQSEGAYIQQVSYDDVNLVPGGTYGEDVGYKVDETCEISSFKAIVVDYETFDGKKWKNPYYIYWTSLYEGVKYTDDMSIKVLVIDDEAYTGKANEDGNASVSGNISGDELEAQISEQEVRVISTKYVIQDLEDKKHYPDGLQVIVQNDSGDEIKDLVLAYAAWDKNNLPVIVKPQKAPSEGAYVIQTKCGGINLVPNATYGEDVVFELDESCEPDFFKAIVVSYETFEGKTWNNPLFNKWRNIYEEKKLADNSVPNDEDSTDSGLMIGSRTIAEIRQELVDGLEKRGLHEYVDLIRQSQDDDIDYADFIELLNSVFPGWESESYMHIDAYMDLLIKYIIELCANK